MSGIRQRFVQFLRRQALQSGQIVRLIKGKPGVRILMHHGVGVRGYPADALEQQVAWLRKHFELLSMTEVVARLRDGKPLPNVGVVLTFDDGLRNNLTDALPILQEHQAPAEYFVCPGLIDSGEWIWTYEVRARLAVADKSKLPTPPANKTFADWMKSRPHGGRLELLQAVRAASATWTPSEQERKEGDLMTWDELHGLDTRLITIGSHTATHPMLASMDAAGIEGELSDSLARLQQQGFARNTPVLCYPNGDHDERVVAAARRSYDGACVVTKGLVTQQSGRHELMRIGASSPLEDVAWRLWRPGA